MTSNITKILKKWENALLEKNFKVIFSTFFLLRLSLSDPLFGFYSKKPKNVHYIVKKNVSKKGFFG